jgi:hypothetical protein
VICISPDLQVCPASRSIILSAPPDLLKQPVIVPSLWLGTEAYATPADTTTTAVKPATPSTTGRR